MNNRIVISEKEQKQGLFLHYKMIKDPHTEYIFCEEAMWYLWRSHETGKWNYQTIGHGAAFTKRSISDDQMTFWNQYTYTELVELILVDLL